MVNYIDQLGLQSKLWSAISPHPRFVINPDRVTLPGDSTSRVLLGKLRLSDFTGSNWHPVDMMNYEHQHIVYIFNWALATFTDEWTIYRHGPYHDLMNYEQVIYWHLVAYPEEILEFKLTFPNREI